MSETTKIQWADATWNPWQGCTKVSAGCDNCYMFRDKKRYGQNPAKVVRSSPQTFNMPKRLPPGLNHSKSPNVDTRTWTTLRYIRAGEELTINYEEFPR